jgi:hypothetical protein
MRTHLIAARDRLSESHCRWFGSWRRPAYDPRRRAIIGLLASLLISAAPADAGAPKVLAISLVNGAFVGSDNTIRVQQGDDLELRWSSDKPMELHLHGYDIEVKVSPQSPAVMSFKANIPGRFPVEAHGTVAAHQRPVLYLEVSP